MFEERHADELEVGDLRRACVVIPIVLDDEGSSLVFLKRSEGMRVHKGQVAFPGGSIEPGEELEEAAVRETEEEIGVRRDEIRIIGRLDDVITRTGFLVAPFVGVIPSSYSYVPHEAEVTDIFEVPIASLLAPGNPEVRYLSYAGEQYPVYFYHHGEREIWGLTGRILKSFLDVVRLAV